MSARVAAVVLSWNGAPYLERCLGSLLAQSHPDLEIVVFDNGSSDRSREIARRILQGSHRPHRVLESVVNVGFAAGNDEAIAACDAPFVLCANQDVELETDYVARLMAAMDGNPMLGAAAGCLLREDRVTIDSMGQRPSYARRCVEEGAGTRIGDAPRGAPRRVFSVCAAAALYRRKALDLVSRDPGVKTGPFDADFFAYYEDLDLGWRLQRAGWDAMVVPAARAYHVRGGSAPGSGRMLGRLAPALRLHVLQNRFFTVLRNESASGLLLHLPGFLLWEALLWIYLSARDGQTLAAHARSLPVTIQKGLAKRAHARSMG
ncbi:MAG: glycosyltransferase family 2 protein [Acidobacteriota bacterium]